MSGRAATGALAALALLGACGDDDNGDDDAGTTTTEATATTATTAPPEPSSTSTTAAPVEADPLDAAEAFLTTFFPGSAATLSEFRAGDARSGEVEVLRPREGGGTASVASTLLLRLDGDQWQVIGAVNPNVTIEDPANGAEVAGGEPLVVEGLGRGFEALIVARAFDEQGTQVAEGIGSGGALADPEPYSIELDLSAVGSGTPLVLVVSGGTGLDRDPGEFSAIRIAIEA